MTVVNMECRAGMMTLPGDSIDAVVTDPPYGLSKEPDMAEVLRHWLAGDDYNHSGGGFMGKSWDSFVPGPATWREALRVLKPGGHALVFAGSRTQDLMATSLRLAGFEIRDTAMWLYGSGFPKSLNVSKAIDKVRKEDIEPIRAICRFIRAGMDAKKLKSKNLTQLFDDCHPRLIDHWAARDTDSQPTLPKWGQWLKLKTILNFTDQMDAEVWRLNGRKGAPGDVYQNAEVLSEQEGAPPGFAGKRFTIVSTEIKKPSDTAKHWEGYGTALKPAYEPIIIARKPLAGTVAETVLEYGTGALNIDGCRVPFAGNVDENESKAKNQHADFNSGPMANDIYGKFTKDRENYNPPGRWPANILHDGSYEVTELFPRTKSGGTPAPGKMRTYNGIYSKLSIRTAHKSAPDSGSAARYFYCAKASKADRNAGCERNTHPTVKPTELMRWCCRLVGHPGALILDPFTGSGGTGRGAILEGFEFVGFQWDPDDPEGHMVNIANARINEVR